MYHFFTKTENITDTVLRIEGPDVNHIKNVLRMKPGEKILVSDGHGLNKIGAVETLSKEEVILTALPDEVESTELPCKVYLFQGLPKSDKMELIIQKAVELGVHAIVPVDTKRTVVRLDAKKEAAKISRWQSIAESAAKQSGRMIIPEVMPVMKFKDAIGMSSEMDIRMIPYEAAETISGVRGMEGTREIIKRAGKDSCAAVFIGPEGGFEMEEIEFAMDHEVSPVTLGRRILRTETAGLFVLSAFGLLLE